ncbi:hypothetical protein AMAG_16496 [Allomyces macrogynus ATCC 38327]|uniref:AB hydrolase-1 domain-containing protein n=1 Tax=Allomyces macrogynus (strain ATCC 38327) TaxID=578462 RepID=A0A0L0TCH9_ALLM3|nr:hypothetical protein AMAG_16496 [Allomyces macrogynus ATCC 38327]|eukprot:KNE72452.1 hypothetical protein AMAG_16496 [Allomyces macrogynus ATCC 38327]
MPPLIQSLNTHVDTPAPAPSTRTAMNGPWTSYLPPWLIALTLRHPLASKFAAAATLAVAAYVLLCRKRTAARPLALPDGTRVYSPPFVFQNARYLTVNGKVLRVLHRHGPQEKPAVVFLHGMGGNLAQWAPLMEKVAEYAEVVGVECVGHGMSKDTGRPDDYRTLSMVDDIASALTSTLPPTRDLVLVCHSYGCCMGTYLAASHLGPRIRGMVYLGGRALMPPTAIIATRKLAALPSPILTLLRLYDRWGGINSASVTRYLGPGSPRDLRALQAIWNKHLENTQLKALAGGLQWVGEDEYNKVACPVLVIMGDKDGAVPVGASVEDYRRVLAGKAGTAEPVVVLPGIGHQVMLEATEEVWTRMTRFLVEACGVKLV